MKLPRNWFLIVIQRVACAANFATLVGMIHYLPIALGWFSRIYWWVASDTNIVNTGICFWSFVSCAVALYKMQQERKNYVSAKTNTCRSHTP